jgi:hypothetical protein
MSSFAATSSRGPAMEGFVCSWRDIVSTKIQNQRTPRQPMPSRLWSDQYGDRFVVPFGKTHDLAALGRLCADIDRELAGVGQRATMLTDYAWKYRYPGEPEEPSLEEAKSALALAQEVYKAVLGRLPTEARPASRPPGCGNDTEQDR